jgi:hypothetical protein
MSGDPDLTAFLEPTQLTTATRQPLPRRKLSRATTAFLILLRIYVFIAIPIVAYAFIHAMRASP